MCDTFFTWLLAWCINSGSYICRTEIEELWLFLYRHDVDLDTLQSFLEKRLRTIASDYDFDFGDIFTIAGSHDADINKFELFLEKFMSAVMFFS